MLELTLVGLRNSRETKVDGLEKARRDAVGEEEVGSWQGWGNG